jgi:hypothetical protein
MIIGSETEKVFFPGCSKMPKCKAPEIVRSEAYLAYAATRKDLPEGRGNAADGLFSAAC